MVPVLIQGEEEQLAYQFQWETCDRILQEETRLSSDKKSLRWSHANDLSVAQLAELFPCESNDVVLAVNYGRLYASQDVYVQSAS